VTRHRDDQPQVRVHQEVLGVEIAALDALGELDLLVGIEKAVLARAPQELVQRGREDVMGDGGGRDRRGQQFLSGRNPDCCSRDSTR
jgi:hypothetical protein